VIGKLRHRITFQQENRTDDGAGGGDLSWTDIAGVPTVWARVEPVSTGEALRAMQLQSGITHRITLREKTEITTAMRIVFEGRYFNIRGIRHIEERGRWTEITAEEGVAV
jgi:SPP1 family predicted phage head-tail adaptor